ncbi:caskin-2 [Etheostoma spectabile]|uniref:caskin-2 n=1 Tax=Etheostoma spectabile TaxID=54343 RepID=UPI0013AEBBD3|nr:caskin-2-like [Etheostoma spectabile]
MTPEDLTAIGVTKPGHRKKISMEINKLNIPEWLPEYIPSDLGEWLSAIGLLQYHKKLSENGYDSISIVRDLTWEDLQEIGIIKLGHQKKLMLAVRKLCDIQRAALHAESGPGGTLRRKPPGALHLVAIEPPADSAGGEGSSPRTPKMTTFQDSELSAELQTAMSGHHGEDGLAIRTAAGMSQSQDSFETRSRGSGRSGEPPTASVTPHSWSQENLDASPARERNLPEGWDQRAPPPPHKQVPLGTATVFKYPAIPAKPKVSAPVGLSQGLSPGLSQGLSPGSSPHGSPALKGFSYLHANCGATDLRASPRQGNRSMTLLPAKKRVQNATRYALSDGEPDEDEDDEDSAFHRGGNVPSYATLTRSKPGRGQLARLHASPEKNGGGGVGRSQSFAVRARKKGPPPPPPKRLSSVSSTTSGELSDSSTTSSGAGAGGGGTGSPGSGRSIGASLEGLAETEEKNPPDGVQQEDAAGQEAAARRRVQSECISTTTPRGPDPDRGARSDSEEEDPKGSASPHHSSSECIPFAEDGNLTIKQRPKATGPPRAEAVLEPPETRTRTPDPPEFNLKESDTVKRRHKPKDKEPGGGSPAREAASSVTYPPGTRSPSRSQEEERPASPATGSPIRPPLSPKPAVAPKPVRHSLLAAQAAGLPSPSVSVCVVQTVAFTSASGPSSPSGTRAPAPPAPESPSLAAARPQVCVVGPGPLPESPCGTQVVQQRLDQTSTSLAAALKAVERKLEDNSDGGPSTVKSAGTILDDIGNMFDDLADQLDAMLD